MEVEMLPIPGRQLLGNSRYGRGSLPVPLVPGFINTLLLGRQSGRRLGSSARSSPPLLVFPADFVFYVALSTSEASCYFMFFSATIYLGLCFASI